MRFGSGLVKQLSVVRREDFIVRQRRLSQMRGPFLVLARPEGLIDALNPASFDVDYSLKEEGLTQIGLGRSSPRIDSWIEVSDTQWILSSGGAGQAGVENAGAFCRTSSCAFQLRLGPTEEGLT